MMGNAGRDVAIIVLSRKIEIPVAGERLSVKKRESARWFVMVRRALTRSA
jgi:hypothetical protein